MIGSAGVDVISKIVRNLSARTRAYSISGDRFSAQVEGNIAFKILISNLLQSFADYVLWNKFKLQDKLVYSNHMLQQVRNVVDPIHHRHKMRLPNESWLSYLSGMAGLVKHMGERNKSVVIIFQSACTNGRLNIGTFKI